MISRYTKSMKLMSRTQICQLETWAVQAHDNTCQKYLKGEIGASPEQQITPRQLHSYHYSPVTIEKSLEPRLTAISHDCCHELGITDTMAMSVQFLKAFSGVDPLPGLDKPYATNYGCHCNGHWFGQLGDGRAASIGEVIKPGGERMEIQLKGSGRTPFSRGFDGKAVLRSSIREFLASESLFHLGVPATRALCVITTGEAVHRPWYPVPAPVQAAIDQWGDQSCGSDSAGVSAGAHVVAPRSCYKHSPNRMMSEPGAMLTRVASSFFRFGHLELFGMRDDLPGLVQLADYMCFREFPGLLQLHVNKNACDTSSGNIANGSPERYVALFRAIAVKSANLVAEWARVGYTQGNMNSDNTHIAGLTIDFGPFAMMEQFDPNFQPFTSDTALNFAFSRQPDVMATNLLVLGESFEKLLTHVTHVTDSGSNSQQCIDEIHNIANNLYWKHFRDNIDLIRAAKLGFKQFEPADSNLWTELEVLLFKCECDFTIFFRQLGQASMCENGEEAFSAIEDCFYNLGKVLAPKSNPCAVNKQDVVTWLETYLARIQNDNVPHQTRLEQMNSVNPKFILRNWMAVLAYDRALKGESNLVQDMTNVLSRPYDEQDPATSAKWSWVPEVSVHDFTHQSMKDKFSEKKFKHEKTYRVSIVEAVRIATKLTNVPFSEEIMSIIMSYDHEVPWVRGECCVRCFGSAHSGVYVTCGSCNVSDIHVHCLPDEMAERPEAWLCDNCCDNKGLPRGSLVDLRDLPQVKKAAPRKRPSNTSNNSNAKKIIQEVELCSAIANDDQDDQNTPAVAQSQQRKGGLLSCIVRDIRDEQAQAAKLSQEAFSAAATSTLIGEEYDDICFVCKETGQLILCDFPQCKRAYHKLCVYATGVTGIDCGDDDSDGVGDDNWFCPAHSCASCATLQLTAIHPNLLKIPSSFIVNDAIKKPWASKISQKLLRSCSACPVSLCLDCESGITGPHLESFFVTKKVVIPVDHDDDSNNCSSNRPATRRSHQFKVDLECRNCSAGSGKVKLAVLLEAAWARMASSRLSMPFLRPLLPLISYIPAEMTHTVTVSSTDVECASTAHGDDLISKDLLGIIERIRGLHVLSTHQFFDDLKCLRQLVSDKLALDLKIFCDTQHIDNESSIAARRRYSHDVLLSAFDTLVEAASAFLITKQFAVCEAEKLISSDQSCRPSSSSSHKTASSSEATSRVFDRVWRMECQRSASPVAASLQVVHARSLQHWARYVQTGLLSPAHRGRHDPWSMGDNTRFLSSVTDRPAQTVVAEWLTSLSSKNNLPSHQFEELDLRAAAVSAMASMQHSQGRENITLREDHTQDCTSVWSKLGARYGGSDSYDDMCPNNLNSSGDAEGETASTGWVNDEIWVTLDRLRDMTTRSLHLEARLRKHIETKDKQYSVLQGGDMLTLGEMHAIKELKLSNENLQSRLHQRSQALTAAHSVIAALRESLTHCQDSLATAQAEKDTLEHELRDAKLKIVQS